MIANRRVDFSHTTNGMKTVQTIQSIIRSFFLLIFKTHLQVDVISPEKQLKNKLLLLLLLFLQCRNYKRFVQFIK